MAIDTVAAAPADPGAGSLCELADQALRRTGGHRAIEFEGEWLSWEEVSRVARTVARLVREAGLGQGASVALIARNHPAVVSALLGLIAAGQSVQMIYAFQSAEAIAKDLARLDPGVVIAMSQDFGQPVRTALAAQDIAAIVLEGMTATALPGFEHAARGGEAPNEPQIELLTSGTTGPPKRFAITFDMIARHLMGSSARMAGARSPGEPEGPPFLLFFPLGNISGIYSTVPTMLRGQPVTLLERFSLAAWRDFILRYRPQASGLPPTAFQMLLDADIPREDLASIKVMATGAAPLDPTVQRAFEDKYRIPVLLSYGATEFGGPVATMTSDLIGQFGETKFGSVGRAMPGANLRVIDPDSGAPLAAGREGLLEVVSPRIGPHWIRTSDIAVLDEDGFLFIRGRADGAIMRGGFKLTPDVIERALVLHPAIGAAAVVGVPDRRLGQIPCAAIQLAAGASPVSVEALETHLRRQLPATHIPVHWRIVDDLPKNPSMKIDRPAVARLFAS